MRNARFTHLTPFLLVALTLSLFARPTFAQTEDDADTSPFVKHIYKEEQGGELPYRLLIPDNTDDPMPLLIFLHGAGERGNDNERREHAQAATGLLDTESATRHDDHTTFSKSRHTYKSGQPENNIRSQFLK